MMDELKDGELYWVIEAGTAHGHWQPMFYEQGNWEQFGLPTDPTFKPLRIGPRIPSPEDLADLRERLSASEARVKVLESGLGDLSAAMPDVIYVYDAGCEGSYWTEIEPTEGIYTTINFAALLASPTSPAEPETAPASKSLGSGPRHYRPGTETVCNYWAMGICNKCGWAEPGTASGEAGA